jgi:GMP synthase (glutamine-hydrolysing)
MKIGILQTGHAPDEVLGQLGDYDSMFRQFLGGHGFEFVTYDVVNMAFPTGPADADGWLITGSRHGAYEDLSFIAPLSDLIRAIHAADRPLVGVCFGHQIIAQAMGGQVEKFDGGWSVGRTEYSYKGRTTALNAWHQDQVITVPEGAEVIGSSDFCKAAALVYGDRIWTIQPHPEYGADVIEALVAYRGPGVVPGPLLARVTETLNVPTDRADIAADMAAFLKREG